jgi:hypothetical protein
MRADATNQVGLRRWRRAGAPSRGLPTNSGATCVNSTRPAVSTKNSDEASPSLKENSPPWAPARERQSASMPPAPRPLNSGTEASSRPRSVSSERPCIGRQPAKGASSEMSTCSFGSRPSIQREEPQACQRRGPFCQHPRRGHAAHEASPAFHIETRRSILNVLDQMDVGRFREPDAPALRSRGVGKSTA